MYLTTYLILTELFVGLLARAEQPFPSIWNEKQDGRKEVEKSYRLQAEVRLVSLNRTFIVEEFASVEREEFRMDIVELPADKRRTLLYKRKTRELFVYSPFQCALHSAFEPALLEPLQGAFPVNSSSTDQFPPTGIGALWLHASRSTKRRFIPASPQRDPPSARNAVLRNYDKFVVEPSQEFPWASTFYLYSYGVDSRASIGPEMLAAIETGPWWRPASTPDCSMAHIKLLQLESPFDFRARTGEAGDEATVFDLPVGYGCRRSADLERPYAAPLVYLLDEQPQVLELEAIAMQPVAWSARGRERWRSHSSTIRLVSGVLRLRGSHRLNRYLSVETSEYAAGSGKRVALQRLRRVFDFGEAANLEQLLKSGGASSLSFELDERTGRCLAFEELPLAEDDDDFSAQIQLSGSPGEAGPEVGELAGLLTLDSKFVKSLLSTNDANFHFLGEWTTRNQFDFETRRFVYEKREPEFKMRDNRGKLLWSGPVSLVVLTSDQNSFAGRHKGLRGVTRTSLVVQFYTSQLDKIVSRIQLNVVESRLVDAAAFHRELNLSPCYDSMLAGSSPSARDDEGALEGVNLVVGYQLESAELASQLARFESTEAAIYSSFLESLLIASNQSLDPLQVSKIEVDIDQEGRLLEVSALVVERPKRLHFRQVTGQAFASSTGSLVEFKRHEEACAESCSRYNCTAFSFCPTSGECRVPWLPESDGSSLPLVSQTGCSAYFRRASAAGEFSGAELARNLRQMVNGARASQLGLEIEHPTDGLTRLVPSFVRAGNDLRRDLADLTTNSNSGAVLYTSENANSDLELTRAEYRLALGDMKFKEQADAEELFPVRPAEGAGFEACEELCREVDCKSFAHCEMEKTCLVSQLQGDAELREHAEEAPGCKVMARDQLSKFARAFEAPKSDILELSSGSERVFEASSARDCAINCLKDDECRSFYHCNSQECHLRRKHSARPNQTPAGNQTAGSPKNETVVCTLYQRSYLADFGKFYGRALALPVDEANSIVLVPGAGAELCALTCARQVCAGFQVCRGHQHQPASCGLGFRSGGDRALQLVESAGCTSFLVKPNVDWFSWKPEPSESHFGKARTSSSVWSSLLDVASRLVGFAIGYSLGLTVFKWCK